MSPNKPPGIGFSRGSDHVGRHVEDIVPRGRLAGLQDDRVGLRPAVGFLVRSLTIGDNVIGRPASA